MALNRRTALNLGLLLLVALLGTVVWLEPGLKEPAQQETPLTALTSQQVQQLRLKNAHGELLLQRQSDGWALSEPLTVAADPFQVEPLLQWLTVASLQSYSAEGLDLAKFGLERPRATLSAEGLELRFGDVEPLNQSRYLLLNGVVHLVAENDVEAVTSGWSHFVSPAVIPAAAKIESLTLPGLGVISQGEKGWHYEGATPPASADAMQIVVDGWRNARAISIEPAVTIGGGQVTITFADGHPPLLLVVSRTDDTLILRPESLGIEYHMALEQDSTLFKWSDAAIAEAKQ